MLDIYISTQVVTSLLVTLLTYYIVQKKILRSKLPPGPKGIPLFGNALSIDINSPCKQFLKWSQDYDGVFTINMMGQYIVVVNRKETLAEVYSKKSSDFSNRPQIYRWRSIHKFYNDIISAQVSPSWASLKRASMTALKICGEGLERLESVSLDILQDLTTTLDGKLNQSFDIETDIHDSIASIMASLVYGRKLDNHLIRQLIDIDNGLKTTLSPGGAGRELDAVPWLRFIPFNPNYKHLQNTTDITWKWFTARAALYRKESLNNDKEGAMHLLMKRQKNQNGEKLYEDGAIDCAAINMVMAGVSTTSTALYCLILILIKHPHIQERAQREIDEVIGSRVPRLNDRQACHYVESMLMELLRYISHTPFGIPHETTTDTSILGHKIPKGIQVWADLFSIHHNPLYWENPWDFVPDRFLDAEGAVVTVDHPLRQNWFPFGAGKRSCLGEQLARNRMFLFATCLLQRYTFTSDEELPSCDPRDFKAGVVLSPKNYNIVLKTRE